MPYVQPLKRLVGRRRHKPARLCQPSRPGKTGSRRASRRDSVLLGADGNRCEDWKNRTGIRRCDGIVIYKKERGAARTGCTSFLFA